MIKTHTSYHNSGNINHDWSGASGTSHEHPNKDYWIQEDGTKLTKDNNGVWRTKDGGVFRGSEKRGEKK